MRKTRNITEGAMMIAMVAILLILNRQFAGVLEEMIFWLLSIPLIVYMVRYDIQSGLIVAISCILSSILFSTFTGMVLLISAMVSGVCYGIGLKKGWKNAYLLILAIVSQLLVSALTVIVFGHIFGYDIIAEVMDLTKMVEQAGIASGARTLAMLVVLIVYIGSACMQGIVIHVASHVILARLRIQVASLKPITQVRIPKQVGMLATVGLVIYAISQFVSVPAAYDDAILVLYLVCMMIAITIGVIECIGYGVKKRSRAIVLGALIACFIPVIQNIMMCLGIYVSFGGHIEKLIEK
ncbi:MULTISPECIES: DUF2232 domain-containing protein [unclassified Breznakia]|uniref:DUF2232 domain-containing protein n=1 Tax=unclassified Breznakia TaxID=2623764 RepID=UPI0024736FE6|nr:MULTISPECIES: DUF2232 domain-containing protein [unclassified Breznakia]MDH6368155.1 uncharacterized protein YybS (DUF2232 family) [Breznakia sp. PH1-1]MDH6405252.1 uncharacterized protein YybS (DUF2232 family) [Breznakia sp. PF1-11]MDH6412958.1 uncharacterized protein YybS (DUF2232 family) [Breznakia sp. PFB1-11]MDH6415328.1 uncharacterized protein YybS (DUF2232 family) [Breznakia sp. PFB1-14]MDH6417624.1 uncharacterized protein YybS (DUF2232 family) [Breznakia sp. PFB1-4]